MRRNSVFFLVFSVVLGLLVGFRPVKMSAAAPMTPEVVITGADGVETTLNAENPEKNYGKGKASFSHGVLTLDNTGEIRKIITTGGSLTVEVKGTNTLENRDESNAIYCNYPSSEENGRAVLRIQGDGTLNATAKAYTLCQQRGDLIITGNVQVQASAVAGDPIHVAHSAEVPSSSLSIEGNSSVRAVAGSGSGIRVAAKEGTISISTSGTVEAVCEDTSATWQGALQSANRILISSGTVIASASSKQKGCVQGIYVNTKKGEGKDPALIISGSANVTAKAVTADGAENGRAHGIWANFCRVDISERAVVTAVGTAGQQTFTGGGIHLNGTEMAVSGAAKVTVSAEKNAYVGINLQGENSKLVVRGGNVSVSSAHSYGMYGYDGGYLGAEISGGVVTVQGNKQAVEWAVSQEKPANPSFTVSGTPERFVAGDNAASAKAVTAVGTEKYIQVSFETSPGTTDASLAGGVLFLVLSGATLFVVLRRRTFL